MAEARTSRPTDGSIEISSIQAGTAAWFDVQSYFEHFRLAEHSNASQRIAHGSSKLRRLFSKSDYAFLPLTLDEILQYQEEPLTVPLLSSSVNIASKALKIFSRIQKFLKDEETSLTSNTSLEMIQKLLKKGLKRLEVKDELYMQVLKQSRKNENPQSKLRIWILFNVLASTMPPSKQYIPLITQYVQSVRRDERIGLEIKARVNGTWGALKKIVKNGARMHVPSLDEIHALLTNDRMKTNVYFLNGLVDQLFYGISTTVMDAVEHIAEKIELKNYKTFSLFESVKGEHDNIALEDDRYIADVLVDFASNSSRNSGMQKLVFKKKVFRESDDTIMESQFINLTFVQAQHDYLLGLYPVVYKEAAQLCALQLYSDFGSELPDEDILLNHVIERLTSKEIEILKPREEWVGDVLRKYRRLQCGSQQEARHCFLTLLRSLPYGNSVFFHVNRMDDPIGLLPPKLILGINKNGVHFFRPNPRKYLHTVVVEDIMQLGSSERAVFLKMKVASTLHMFQFETNRGEDICVALQHQINDIMIKRYMIKMDHSQKVIEDSDTLSTVNFGPEYEQYLKDTQTAIDKAVKTGEDLSELHIEHMKERDQSVYRLKDTIKRVRSLELDTAFWRTQVSEAEREVCNLRMELVNVERSVAICKSIQAEDETKLADYQALVTAADKITAEVNQSITRENQMKAHLMQLEDERTSSNIEIKKTEAQNKTEVLALEKGFEEIKTEGQNLCRIRDSRIASLVEQVANVTAMYHHNNEELESILKDQADFISWKKMKKEIEKKEHEHTTTIKNQASKIKDVETKYRQEKVRRRKIHNSVEDLKGKIRVFARVRPMLSHESKRGQSEALSLPDELSISHWWKREDCPREYSFDKVFGPNACQKDVLTDVQDLIQSAIDGYNVCIFAYGQTGSGKTYTIYGNDNNPGLTPQGIDKLFELLLQGSNKYTFSVSCYMLELYQDSLMDLLAPINSKIPTMSRCSIGHSLSGNEKLEVKKGKNSRMVRVQGMTTVVVCSAEELRAKFEAGQKHRHVASTDINVESSRSHLIMGIIIETTDLQTHVQTRGKLSFVDLAGSERIKKSGSTGSQLKEAQAINKSLSALGDVISSLARGDPHIPYRNHKLTMLMSDSLGGNAKTLMFVNVSPTDANLDETQNSLQYAMRVKSIKNDALKDSNKEVVTLKKQIEFWRGLLSSTTGTSDVREMIQEYT
eukprot:g2271.t1